MTEELPEGWVRTTLGEVCQVVSGATPKTSNPSYWGGEISWVTPDDLAKDRSKFIFSGRRNLSQEGYDSCSAKMVPPGSILFSSRAPIGYVAQAGDVLCTNQGFKNLVPPEGIDSNFLYWYMIWRTPEISKRASGTTFKEISAKGVAATEFLLPSLAEQRRIVAVLEAEMSRLDAASGVLAESVRRTSLLLSSAAQRAVRGNLQPVDDVPTGDSVDLEGLMEIRQKMAAKKKPPMPSFGELDFQLPPGWCMASIGQLAWSIEYGTSLKSSKSRSDDDVPVLRMGNIQDGKIDPGKLKYLPRLPELESLILEDGDFLFNRTNSAELVGKSAVYKGELGAATYASYLIRCRFVPGVDPDWVSLVVNSAFGRSYISKVVSQQVGQANVNGTKLAAFPVPLPSLFEQREILGVYQTWVSAVERLKGGLRAAQTQALAMRRSLLASAFTGKLVPQDPSDEPAFELLSRIRAEQAGALKTKRGRRAKASPSSNSPVPVPEDSRPVSAGEQTALEF